MKSLFQLIMEADGDLEDFDPGMDSAPADAPADAPPEAADDGLMPPDAASDDGGDLQGFGMGDDSGDAGMGDDGMGDTSGDPSGDQEATEENKSITEKISANLNLQLYSQLDDINTSMDEIIKKLQVLSTAFTTEENEALKPHICNMKKALEAGKNYALNKFLTNEYPTNVQFYMKLKTAYDTISDQINPILKKIK